MSLQEHINRLRREWLVSDREVALDEHIAAGLERDYYLVKLADLPEVKPTPHDDTVVVDGTHYYVGADSGDVDHRRLGLQHLALATFHESRESEAAALQARRDELARELGCYPTPRHGYDDIADSTSRAIDRIIAAEAEVARLRGERS